MDGNIILRSSFRFMLAKQLKCDLKTVFSISVINRKSDTFNGMNMVVLPL